MSEQQPETDGTFQEFPVEPGAHASEVLGPEALDQAILVAVIRRDGSTVALTSNDANRPVVAEWLEALATAIRTAPPPECPLCAAGEGHDCEPVTE